MCIVAMLLSAICTFKIHFISVLATADPDFPVVEWDRLLPQAKLTLNLLRLCRINPRLSAFAYLFGSFDFNKTPLVPAGTKVLVHEKSRQRASWANHGIDAWYIGPSLDHYRCVKCYLTSTGGVRDADTVQFSPKQVPFPKVSTEDMLLQSATVILAILQSPPPLLIPTIQYGDEAKNAIEHLARLLQRAVQRTKPHPPSKPLLPLQHPRSTRIPDSQPPRVPAALSEGALRLTPLTFTLKSTDRSCSSQRLPTHCICATGSVLSQAHCSYPSSCPQHVFSTKGQPHLQFHHGQT